MWLTKRQFLIPVVLYIILNINPCLPDNNVKPINLISIRECFERKTSLSTLPVVMRHLDSNQFRHSIKISHISCSQWTCHDQVIKSATDVDHYIAGWLFLMPITWQNGNQDIHYFCSCSRGKKTFWVSGDDRWGENFTGKQEKCNRMNREAINCCQTESMGVDT